MPERDGPETKRRWDDDVVFRNQARGTEKKGKPEFVNVSIERITSSAELADHLHVGPAAFGLPQTLHGAVTRCYRFAIENQLTILQGKYVR